MLFNITPTYLWQRIGIWLLLALALLGGAAWQWQARAHQQLDIGGPLDDGYTLSFHAPENSDVSGITYRWSQPSAEIRLWGPPVGQTAVLTMRMFAPPQPNGPQRVRLFIQGNNLADMAVVPRPRVYQVLLTTPEPFGEGDIAIGMESPRLADANDPRSLGVAVDQVSIDVIGRPTLRNLISQFWSAPYLPPGLLLLAGCVILAGLPRMLIGGLPAAALVLLLLTEYLLPGTRLMMAAYLVMLALLALLALALVALLRRFPTIQPSDDRRARLWLVGVFLVATVTTFTPTVQSDGTGYYAYLRSMLIDGDLQFANEYRDAPFPHGPDLDKTYNTATGYQINPFAIGPALIWTPLYATAHMLVQGGQRLGLPWRADGYDTPYVVLSMFTSALAGLVTLFASYQISRRYVRPPVATLAVITVFLGSNLLYYAMREGSFAHAVSTAATSLYLLAWLRLEERATVVRWMVVGAAAGAMVLMYWLSALLLLLPALTFGRLLVTILRMPAMQRRRQAGSLLLGGTLAALLFVLVFSPQLLSWKILYGTFITVPQGSDYIEPRRLRLIAFLFSDLRGVLPWSPAFFVGMLGLPLLWWHNRWQTVCLSLAFLAYFLYNASHWQWYAGGAFGPRRITLLTPWFTLGLALLYALLARRSRSLPVVLSVWMIAWMTFLTMRYRIFLIPHDPGLINKLPDLALYFSLETIPVWALPGWTSSSFIVVQVRHLLTSGAPDPLALLLPIMLLATASVIAVYLWLVQLKQGS